MAQNKILLRQTEHFNNIPEEFIPALPEPGKVVVFQLKEAIFDPVGGKNGGPITKYPADWQFPIVSRFKNPKTGEWISIALLSREDKDGRPVVEGEDREVLSWRPNDTGGYFRITSGNNMTHDAMYQYLMLCSDIEGNDLTDEMRDPSRTVTIRLIDYEKQAQRDLEAQNLRWEAVKMALNMTPQQVKEVSYLLGNGKDMKEAQVLASVRGFAETQPELFLEYLKDVNSPLKARIAQAMDLGIVQLDTVAKKLRWSDGTKREIMSLTSFEPADIQSEYAERCQEAEFLKVVDAAIADQIKKKEAPAKPTNAAAKK